MIIIVLTCLWVDHIKNDSTGLAQRCMNYTKAGKSLPKRKLEQLSPALSKGKFFQLARMLETAAAAVLCFPLELSSNSLTQNRKSW